MGKVALNLLEDPATFHRYDCPWSTSHPEGLPASLLTQGSQSQGEQMRGNPGPTELLTLTFCEMDVVGEYSELTETGPMMSLLKNNIMSC